MPNGLDIVRISDSQALVYDELRASMSDVRRRLLEVIPLTDDELYRELVEIDGGYNLEIRREP